MSLADNSFSIQISFAVANCFAGFHGEKAREIIWSMLSLSEQLTVVYCPVDDGLKSEKNGGRWRKSNHNPKCTDAEIIAVAMERFGQSYFGCATLKRTYLLVKAKLRLIKTQFGLHIIH